MCQPPFCLISHLKFVSLLLFLHCRKRNGGLEYLNSKRDLNPHSLVLEPKLSNTILQLIFYVRMTFFNPWCFNVFIPYVSFLIFQVLVYINWLWMLSFLHNMLFQNWLMQFYKERRAATDCIWGTLTFLYTDSFCMNSLLYLIKGIWVYPQN